jgi:hypothetical protein
MKAKIEHTVKPDTTEVLELVDKIIATVAMTYESVDAEKLAILSLLFPEFTEAMNDSFKLGKKMALSDVKDDEMYA